MDTLSNKDTEKARLIFTVLDADGDGVISLADLKSAQVGHGVDLSEDDLSQMLAVREKKIDLSEFMSIFKSKWEGFDAADDVQQALAVFADADADDQRQSQSQSQSQSSKNKHSNQDNIEIPANRLHQELELNLDASSKAQDAMAYFVKENAVTGEKTFKGSDFLDMIRK